MFIRAMPLMPFMRDRCVQEKKENENCFQMIKEENILDSDEIIKSNFDKNHLYGILGFCFFFAIPIMFLLAATDDSGFFLPRSELIDFLAPKSLIHLQDEFEIRFLEEYIGIWLILYFFIMSIFNFGFWRNGKGRKFRIYHAIISIGIPIFSFWLMVEDDIYHELKIRDPIGRQQFLMFAKIFYFMFLVWIIFQIAYLKVFFDKQLKG